MSVNGMILKNVLFFVGKIAFWALQEIKFPNRVNFPRIDTHFSKIKKKRGLSNTFCYTSIKNIIRRHYCIVGQC